MALTSPHSLMLHVGAALLALAQPMVAQISTDPTIRWRISRLGDGLPETGCVSVGVSGPGRVLVRQLYPGAASELDGYGVKTLPSPGPGNGRIYCSPAGQLWAVESRGLQELKNGRWVLHPVGEIAAELRAQSTNTQISLPLMPTRQGLVLFLLPDRLVEFNAEDPDHPRTDALLKVEQTRLGRFTDLTAARDGGLWITGEQGLLKLPGPARALKAGTTWQQFSPAESLQLRNLQQPVEDAEGVVTVVADSLAAARQVLAAFDGQHWTAEAIPVPGVIRAWRSVDHICCGLTPDSLYVWKPGAPEAAQVHERAGRRYYDAAVEPGGAFWLATSDGPFRFAPMLWRSAVSAESLQAPIQCLTPDESGSLWFVAAGSLQRLQHGQRRQFPLPKGGQRDAPVVEGLFPLKNSLLWVQTSARSELARSLQFQPDSGTFSPVPQPSQLARLKPLGLLRDGRLCIQAFGMTPRPQDSTLQAYDGTRLEPLSVPLPEATIGEEFISFFAAQNGDLWISGERGTACWHEQKWRSFVSSNRSGPTAVVGFAELPDGRVWCATRDKVWAFDGRDWSAIRTALDHINDLAGARDGSLWVATDSGLQRFLRGTWVEHGVDEGLPGETVAALCEDALGRICAGTTRGLSVYHPDADSDPPQVKIQAPGKGGRYREGAGVNVSFTALDRWNYTPRSRLLYSWRIDSRDWSLFQEERAVPFVDLPAGKHYFQVRAMDRNSNVDPEPARFEFAIVPPWYKESRPVAIAVAGLAVALFFAGLALNRHWRLLRSYAEVERKVAQRTQELELANRQLLHSQKMNALGALAAGIAHDFNNILSIIKGSAQIIEDNMDNPEKVHTRVDRIKTVVEQGAGIVQAMLGFSRESGERPEPCDINTVVEDTVKLLGDRFVREVQINLERAPDLPAVPCSKDLVQQVLLNFIFNAAEAMNQRKLITLSTRSLRALPPALVLQPAAAQRYVGVTVKDTGCGIAPDILPRIFEPFFTTKAMSARRGTGLGLSMVYELARKMEAGLSVESVVDQGSTFTLILPVREEVRNASS